jgi:uncharacterized membrane protein
MTTQYSKLLGKYAIFKENHERPKKSLGTKIDQAVEDALKKRGLAPSNTTQEVAESPKTDVEKLINVTEAAQKPLLTAQTVFPFVLFPGTIDIDRQKVTIVHRSFFRVASTFSLQIEDLQVVTVDVGPFFGSVHLASKFFIDNLQTIDFLKRADAVKIQRLLQGYMIAKQRGIDCSAIDEKQLLTLLNDLGQGASRN